MVLRPHLLRYKGSVKKLDSQKMQQINKRMKDAEAAYGKAKIVPKGLAVVGVGALATLAVPFIYLSSKQASGSSYVDQQNKQSNRMERSEGELMM